MPSSRYESQPPVLAQHCSVCATNAGQCRTPQACVVPEQPLPLAPRTPRPKTFRPTYDMRGPFKAAKKPRARDTATKGLLALLVLVVLGLLFLYFQR